MSYDYIKLPPKEGRDDCLYLRKSRMEEVTDTTGEVLQRHKEILLDLTTKYGIHIRDDMIFEEVVSGGSLYARPEMLKILELLENNALRSVTVMDIDRLGRGNMREQGMILEAFKDSGTKIITPRKVYDLDDENDEEMTEFEAFFARRELKVINRRLNGGREKVTKDGGHITLPPYGYKRKWIDAIPKKLPSLEPVPEEANYVRMMYDMYVNQGMGATLIAEALNGLGSTPHQYPAWGKSSVMHVLKNPVYIGKIVRGRKKYVRKGEKGNTKTIVTKNDTYNIVEGLHEAIIDEETYRLAQEVRERKYHPSYRKADTLENPMAGLIKCRNCGYNLQMRFFSGKKVHWLLCSRKGCIKSTRIDRVEKSLLAGLANSLEALKLQRAEGSNSIELQQLQETIQHIEKEITKTQKQLDNMYDFLEQGVYTVEVFSERSESVSKKLKLLKKSLIELNEKSENLNTDKLDIMIKKLEHVLTSYPESDTNTKNYLLKTVMEKAVYYKESDWSPDQFELEIFLEEQ